MAYNLIARVGKIIRSDTRYRPPPHYQNHPQEPITAAKVQKRTERLARKHQRQKKCERSDQHIAFWCILPLFLGNGFLVAYSANLMTLKSFGVCLCVEMLLLLLLIAYWPWGRRGKCRR